MTDSTYGAAPPTGIASRRQQSARSLLRRIYEGMIEARQRQAEIILRDHLYGAF